MSIATAIRTMRGRDDLRLAGELAAAEIADLVTEVLESRTPTYLAVWRAEADALAALDR